MKRVVMAVLWVTLLGLPSGLSAQEAPPMPAPQKEHEWLRQLVGEWETNSEAVLEAGKPPLKCQGTESVRSFGEFWVASEIKNSLAGNPMGGLLTIGYDPEKRKYVGTWIDTMTSHLWKYEGTVDARGKILTLEAEGPNPTMPGKRARYRDVTEFKSRDHKVLTSSMQLADGTWVPFMTMHCRRKK